MVDGATEERRGEAQDHYAYHDPKGDARLSTTLVHALADVMGHDVTETGFVLAEEIDPEALDRLFSPASGDGSVGHVAFSVNEHRVTVYSDGAIVITPPEPTPALPEQ